MGLIVRHSSTPSLPPNFMQMIPSGNVYTSFIIGFTIHLVIAIEGKQCSMSEVTSAATLADLFLHRIVESKDATALLVKRGGRFQPITWNQLAGDVRRTAAMLVRLGAGPGDRVVQISENCYEWIVVDLAVQLAQLVHVPLHASLSGQQMAWQIVDSQACIVILAGDHQAKKISSSIDQSSANVAFLSFEPCTIRIGIQEVRLLCDERMKISEVEGRAIEGRVQSASDPDALATILYTSGTTGEPKGVMLSQRNLTTNTLSTLNAIHADKSDVRLSFLPLSHIFARTCDLYTWIASGCQLALAEDRELVLADCSAVTPTLLNGVPYFFDKVYRILTEQGKAMESANSLRSALGGRMRLCASGGAALPDHVCQFFHDHGVPLVQGYGLTETSPVITSSTATQWKLGSVGRTIDGVQVRIAGDGEILTRGPNVMMGYWKNRAATDEVIRDGWLHTGDIGQLDTDGFLCITGRKKELIVTAAGKNVAPVHLESLLLEDPLIDQAMVVGDGRKFLTALIVPHFTLLADEVRSWGISVTGPQEMVADPHVVGAYEARIKERLVDVSQHEQIGRITLLNRQFTIEHGELTPKLSLRRSVIAGRFAKQIESMYV